MSEKQNNPVMLALSTFRQSEKAVNLALEKAVGAKVLVIVFIVDINIERYMTESDLSLFSELKERAKEEILAGHKKQAEKLISEIKNNADKLGIRTRNYLRAGRFGEETVKILKEEKPALIITTRSKRPLWLRKVFGSPVDYLISKAACPVIEF